MEKKKHNIRKDMVGKYTPETINIAKVLLLSGECDRDEIDAFFDGNTVKASNYLYRHTHLMKVVKRTVKIERKNCKAKLLPMKLVRPICSTSKEKSLPFKKLADEIDPSGKAYNNYIKNIWGNGKLRVRGRAALRNAVVAHTYTMLLDIFDIDVWARPELREYKKTNAPIPMNTFFPVNEIKYYARDGEKELIGSIALGAIVCPAGVYSLFCLRRPPEETEWSEGREGRFQTHTSNIFRELNCDVINKDVNTSDNRVMVIGSQNVATAICFSLLTNKKRGVIKIPDQTTKVIFIPDDKSGREILSILTYPGYHQKIKDLIIRNKSHQFNSETEDGWRVAEIEDENGNVVGEEKMETLIWLDNDLKRLCGALNKEERSVDKLEIVCLSSQMELVEKIVTLFRSKKITVLVNMISYERAIKELNEEEKK